MQKRNYVIRFTVAGEKKEKKTTVSYGAYENPTHIEEVFKAKVLKELKKEITVHDISFE